METLRTSGQSVVQPTSTRGTNLGSLFLFIKVFIYSFILLKYLIKSHVLEVGETCSINGGEKKY